MDFENLFLPKKKIFFIIFFIVVSIITIILSLGTINLQFGNDVTVLLPKNDETEFEKEKNERLGKEFSSAQLLFIAVDGNPFSEGKIEKLWELCNDLEKLDVVKSTLNPFNAIYFTKSGREDNPIFNIGRMNPSYYPKTKEQIDEFIDKISSNSYLVGSIISYNKKVAGIVVRLNFDAYMGEEVEKENIFMKFQKVFFGKKFGPKKITRTYFCNQVENVLDKYKDDLKIYFAGVPVYEAKIKKYMQKDILILIIPIFIMMTFIFFMNFRTTRGTITPIISILLSMGWTIGIIGWLRYEMNIVSILIPPIVMTVGSSYTLHYLNSYYITSAFYDNPRDLVYNSTKHILPTILLAALTTIVGFASFLTAKIGPIKSFGFFIIISIIFTLFFTFFLLSKILAVFKLPKTHKMENVKNDMFSRMLNFYRSLVVPLRYLWVGVFVAVMILFAVFIRFLRVETNAVNFFKKNDMVKQSLIFIQKNFHGTNHYNITIRSVENKKDFFKSREGLEAAKKVQDYLDNNVLINDYEMIGWNVSLVSLVEDLNIIMQGKKDLPDNDRLITRFMSFLTISRNADEGLKAIVNNNFSAINFQVRPHTNNLQEDNVMTETELFKLTDKLKNDLNEIAAQDGRFTIEIWGEILVIASISKYLVKDQIWSLSFTVILVFLITLLIFRSPYFAFFSLIPLTFGVIMNFTVMSIFKIPLDAATVMIAAISIGIGIDDSIHFILHYKKTLEKGNTAKEAILHTLSYTARPILFTSLALILGFIVFTLSSFRPIAYFGLLIALSMFNCTFATLFILPSFFLISDKIRHLIHRKKKS